MKNAREALLIPQIAVEKTAIVLPAAARTVRFVGSVTRERSERVLKEIEKLQAKQAGEIGLFVSSPGGATGVAMSFFDTITQLMHPELVTIGSGDVDSSGIIIFLAGTRRYLSPNTTLLLHPAGRVFGNARYTTAEMAAMLAEDTLKDQQYAQTLASRTRGILSAEEVLALMARQSVLSPAEAVAYGFAEAVLPRP